MSALDFISDRRAPVSAVLSATVLAEARALLQLIPRGAAVEFGGVLTVWPGMFFAEFAGYWIGLGQGSIVRDGDALQVTTPAGVHRVPLAGLDRIADAGPTMARRRSFFPKLKQGGTYAAHCAKD